MQLTSCEPSSSSRNFPVSKSALTFSAFMRSPSMMGFSTMKAALIRRTRASVSAVSASRMRYSDDDSGDEVALAIMMGAVSSRSGENCLSWKTCRGAKLFLDPQELVVFRNAIGARSRSRLDLSGCRRDRKVSDKRILRFARPVRNDRVITRLACQFDGVDRFCNTANLVQLDQNRVRDSIVDSARQPLGVGYEKVVANKLNFLL